MHQNKQFRPALFAVHARLYNRFFLACYCVDDESERGERVEREVFSNFANGKVEILEST